MFKCCEIVLAFVKRFIDQKVTPRQRTLPAPPPEAVPGAVTPPPPVDGDGRGEGGAGGGGRGGG